MTPVALPVVPVVAAGGVWLAAVFMGKAPVTELDLRPALLALILAAGGGARGARGASLVPASCRVGDHLRAGEPGAHQPGAAQLSELTTVAGRCDDRSTAEDDGDDGATAPVGIEAMQRARTVEAGSLEAVGHPS